MNKNLEDRYNTLGADIILTFEDDVPEDIYKLMEEHCFNGQQMYQQIVKLISKGYRDSGDFPEEWMINGRYSCEKHILSQIIPDIEPQELKPYILKISLWFFKLSPKLKRKLLKGEMLPHEEVQKVSKSLSIYTSFNQLPKEEQCRYYFENRETEDEFSFIKRSNSKYYFQPDQRTVIEDDIVETFGNSQRVPPISERTPKLPDSHFKEVSYRRILTEVYFRFKDKSYKNLPKEKIIPQYS